MKKINKYYSVKKLQKLLKKKFQIVIGVRHQGKFPFAPNEGENHEN